MSGIGPPEIILVLLVLVLLFGAKKLPELARGSGRALRIFKAETKGLLDDEEDKRTPEQRQVDAQHTLEAPPTAPPTPPPVAPPTGQPTGQPSTRPTGEPPAT